ncbi:hypothetical protein AAAV73_04650, partial [Hominicoprocola fusiformis]|nr:hypothetical protein [Hominicoprocola fusiformis]
GVTFVTPPLENTRFSSFFDFTVLRPPGYLASALFCPLTEKSDSGEASVNFSTDIAKADDP